MRYGKFLPDGGTIGFAAPAFGSAMEPYRTAFAHVLDKWTKAGYKIELGRNVYASDGTGISSTPQNCGGEFTEMYTAENNDCLISCGGGELMCEILDFVDWEKVSDAPAKWFMGFSDNTNLTYVLATRCDTAAIYGPCAASFGMEPPHESLKDAFGMLTGKTSRAVSSALIGKTSRAISADAPSEAETEHGSGSELLLSNIHRIISVHGYPQWESESLKDEENPFAPYHLTEDKVLCAYCGGEDTKLKKGEEIPEITMRGRLLGGCLDCLANLPGTSYDRTREFADKYADDGIIWFLEACDLNVFSIRRAMWQLDHAGWFSHVNGFLIGRPLAGWDAMMNLDRYGAVLETAAKLHVPVIMDCDFGHRPPMMPLITGSLATVRVRGNDLQVNMELV